MDSSDWRKDWHLVFWHLPRQIKVLFSIFTEQVFKNDSFCATHGDCYKHLQLYEICTITSYIPLLWALCMTSLADGSSMQPLLHSTYLLSQPTPPQKVNMHSGPTHAMWRLKLLTGPIWESVKYEPCGPSDVHKHARSNRPSAAQMPCPGHCKVMHWAGQEWKTISFVLPDAPTGIGRGGWNRLCGRFMKKCDYTYFAPMWKVAGARMINSQSYSDNISTLEMTVSNKE